MADLINNFIDRINSAGYPAGKNTWKKVGNTIHFIRYDEDYDISMSKEDQKFNTKFVNTLFSVCDKMTKDKIAYYNVDEDNNGNCILSFSPYNKSITESMIYGYMLAPINEANLNDIIPKEDQNKIINKVKSYKNEINKYCKTTDDKDFIIQFDDDYPDYRYNGITNIKIRLYYNDGVVLEFSKETYDFPKAHAKVCKMIQEKLSKESELSDYKFTVKNFGRTSDILIEPKAEGSSDKINAVRNFQNKIDAISYNAELDMNKIQALTKEIKENPNLSNSEKSMLLNNLKAKITWVKEFQKEKEEYISNMSEEDKKLVSVYKILESKLNKAGYKSSRKTWQIAGYNPNEQNYFVFVAYDSSYSGTNSDYDNGLTDKDKESNKKFVDTLIKLAKQTADENGYKLDYDIYRGDGYILFIKK